MSRVSVYFTAFAYLALGMLSSGMSCSSTPKCLDGGELQWLETSKKKWKGDRKCRQFKNDEGEYQNHGKYIQFHPNGEKALEGVFRKGLMDGTWSEYNENGRKIREKYFVNGVEKSAPPSGKKDDPEVPDYYVKKNKPKNKGPKKSNVDVDVDADEIKQPSSRNQQAQDPNYQQQHQSDTQATQHHQQVQQQLQQHHQQQMQQQQQRTQQYQQQQQQRR